MTWKKNLHTSSELFNSHEWEADERQGFTQNLLFVLWGRGKLLSVTLGLSPADHCPKQAVLPDTECVSLQDSTQSVYTDEEEHLTFRTKQTEEQTTGQEDWRTEVNVSETFCVYCISSAFVYCIQAEAGQLRLIKKSSLEHKEKVVSKTKYTTSPDLIIIKSDCA